MPNSSSQPEPPPISTSPGQLIDVWLSGVDFAENPGFDHSGDDVYFVPQIEDVEVRSAESTTRCVVQMSIQWSADEQGGPIEDFPFELTIRVTALFDWTGDVNVAEREGWTGFNGPYLMWPYMRSYISTITGFSIARTVTIPTMTVPRTQVTLPDAEGTEVWPEEFYERPPGDTQAG